MKKLFKKLTQNYRLSIILSCVIFVLTYAFVSLYATKGFLSALASFYSIILPKSFFMTLIFSLFFGLLALGLYALFIKIFISIFKVYIIPYSEIFFLTLLIFSIRNLILCCLNLIILFNPVVYVWGGQLFYILTTLPFVGLLYYIFDKYYIHVSASPNVFKVYCLYWAVIIVLRLAIGFGII